MNNEKTQIELSIIVCTKNRARKLASLIQCLGSQKNIEKLNWEIIIVDNNSTDNTREVAYAFCEGSNLRINYIFEPRTGLSIARNIGILTSKGSYLLFLDDDILIPDEFLSNVLFGIQEFPEFQIFGYRVLPDWDVSHGSQVTPMARLAQKGGPAPAYGEARPEGRPSSQLSSPFWLTFKKPFPLIQSFLPVHDIGGETLTYPNRHAKNPIGAVFLVKKEVFEKIVPFREELGAGQSGVCEDTEFFWYALLHNFKILYWPYAVLYHPVLPDRPTIKYLHKWYFNLGKSLHLVKNSGRLLNEKKKPILGLEGIISNKLPPIFETVFLRIKIFNISIFLWLKFLCVVLLLPLTVLLILINRSFYLTTMLAKVLGEMKQSITKN